MTIKINNANVDMLDGKHLSEISSAGALFEYDISGDCMPTTSGTNDYHYEYDSNNDIMPKA